MGKLEAEEKEFILALREKLSTREAIDLTGLSEATIVKYSKGLRKKKRGIYRTMYDILRDMLIVISESRKGLRRTHVMYKANLSHDQLKKYLRILLEKRFVREGEEEGYYEITPKGKAYLELLIALQEEKRPESE